MLGVLRVKPFRGDQVAAGVVVLTVAVALVVLRFAGEWSEGGLLLFAGLPSGVVLALAVLAPMEGPTPRAYQTVLYVSSWVLSLLTLAVLAFVFGDDPPFDRTVALVAAPLAALAAFFAVARNSPTGTFLAAASSGVMLVAIVEWWFDAEVQAVRWVLTLLIVGYLFMVLGQRDRRPAHAVQLANAGGLAALAIALPELVGYFFFTFDEFPEELSGSGWGWELVVLAVGFGLVSYGAVDHERGPTLLGVADLGAFVLLAAFVGDDPGFVGWPLALAVIAVGMIAVGLRPTTPAPPEPEWPAAGGGPATEPVRLTPRDEPEV